MRAIIFILDEEDERKTQEITFTGVINHKIAGGEYYQVDLVQHPSSVSFEYKPNYVETRPFERR